MRYAWQTALEIVGVIYLKVITKGFSAKPLGGKYNKDMMLGWEDRINGQSLQVQIKRDIST